MELFFDYLKAYVTLSEEEVEFLSTKIHKRRYLKGQYIEQHGNVSSFQTYIVSGMVRTFYLDQNGNEHNISFAHENWWAGDLGSFITQNPADFNVQCIENTEVLQMYYKDMETIYSQVPKMERFFRILIQNAYVQTQRRIVQNYSMNASERYDLFCEKYPEVVQRVPQYMIASYLGITKEFLSNIRSKRNK